METEAYAFTDGSFNAATKVYGYGGFLVRGDEQYILAGRGDEPDMASSRNVAGEVGGAVAAIEKALELGIRSLTIYFDYTGIRDWALGNWKANKTLTKEYKAVVADARMKGLSLVFEHVKGHTGIAGNELADSMAKVMVGNTGGREMAKARELLAAEGRI